MTAEPTRLGCLLTPPLTPIRSKPRSKRLVEAEVDGERLTQPEILSFFQLLLLGGSETTTNLINNAILCFIENPDQLVRLRAAPDLLPSAIEEVRPWKVCTFRPAARGPTSSRSRTRSSRTALRL